MNDERYQTDFFANNNSYRDAAARRRKARTIHKILEHHRGSIKDAILADFGCSSGFISDDLATNCKQVIGLDIDVDAIEFARQKHARDNLQFVNIDGIDTGLEASSIDIVVCNHVYEHVPNPKQLMLEIKRILKPGGICYFSAGNRWQINEPHYNLYGLSWLPKSLAHRYLSIRGRGNHYYETHLTLPNLKKLVSDFDVTDYTRKVIQSPERFGMEYILPQGSIPQRVLSKLSRPFYYMIPTYLWVLTKPKGTQ